MSAIEGQTQFLALNQSSSAGRAAFIAEPGLRLRTIDPNVVGGDAAGEIRWLKNLRNADAERQ
jgi:hypothetical protein